MKVSWVIGVPPVLIHFSLGFSMKSTIQRAWVPHLMCDWCVIRHDSANAAALFLRVSLGCRGGAAREAEHHQPHLGETGCTQIAGSAGFHKWEYPQMDGKPDENGWFGGTMGYPQFRKPPCWSCVILYPLLGEPQQTVDVFRCSLPIEVYLPLCGTER